MKKLRNMKVMFIPIVIGSLGTVTNGLLKRLENFEIRRQLETIQTTKLLRSAKILRGGPRGVMVKAMDCGIVVSEFVLQLRYYVHFQANTLGKGMNHLILLLQLWVK